MYREKLLEIRILLKNEYTHGIRPNLMTSTNLKMKDS